MTHAPSSPHWMPVVSGGKKVMRARVFLIGHVDGEDATVDLNVCHLVLFKRNEERLQSLCCQCIACVAFA